MKDASTLTHKDFEDCLGQLFTVTPEHENPIEVELTQVKLIGTVDSQDGARQAFSLLLRGPKNPVMLQSIYRIENTTLGEMLLFLVPVSADEQGILYDISFT